VTARGLIETVWDNGIGRKDDSRKDAKAQRTKKFEARNTKFETNSNDQKAENSKRARFGF
jgi:hypothetical protein